MPIARSAERLGRRLSSALALTAALVLPALSAGCVSNAKGPITNALGITPSPIEDKEFAAHLHTVLRGQKPGDAASALRLGVVKQQLSHASGRFDRGSDDRGLHSVLGAFYLLRQGDRGDPLIDATTSRAFDGAIRRVSARGDLGKARYLLGLIATARKAGKVPGSAAESEAHVADLDRWVSDTRKGSPIEKAGEAERAAVSRVLLDPSKNASNDATQAISGWIDLAIEINIAFRQTGRRPTQEEAIESTRALESGAPTLVAMGLRLGDLDATVASVEGSSARRIVDPDFYRVLKSSSQANTGQSWRAVFAELDRQTSDKIGGEIGVDEELLDAAFFNAALEAYRREPTDLPICVELSRSLVSYGMSEAVPLVMADGLGGAQPSSENLGAAISLVRAALDADASSGDYAATARTIAASGTFLEVAGKAAAKTAALAPLRYDMASIQIHAGDLEAAKASLEAATQEAPSSAGLKLLAMVERQLGDTKGALALAARSSEVRGADPLDAADAQLLIYEIERSAGQKDEAAASLERALKSTLKARTRNGAAPYRVRAERMLGSILLAYGERTPLRAVPTIGRSIRSRVIAGSSAPRCSRRWVSASSPVTSSARAAP